MKGDDNFELIRIMRPSHRWNDHLFHLKRFEGSCQICREVNVSLEHCHITHDHLKAFHSLVHLFHAFIWSNVASSFSIPCFHIARNHRNIEVRGKVPVQCFTFRWHLTLVLMTVSLGFIELPMKSFTGACNLASSKNTACILCHHLDPFLGVGMPCHWIIPMSLVICGSFEVGIYQLHATPAPEHCMNTPFSHLGTQSPKWSWQTHKTDKHCQQTDQITEMTCQSHCHSLISLMSPIL